jgi:large subunit ribosomal protein L20
MVRVTNAVAASRYKKRLRKKAKGFVGDRKNHLRQTSDALMSAMAFNYKHRKVRKRDFRSLWIQRLSVAAKLNGLSYSRLIEGLSKAGCLLDRKMLSDLAIRDPQGFAEVAAFAKKSLTV